MKAKTLETREGAPIEVVTRGAVGEPERLRLETLLARLAARSPRRIVFVRGSLTHEQNPSLARPAIAKASFALGGRVVRAHVAASSLTEAVDLLADRLRHSLRELAERDAASHREPGVQEPGEWRHGFPRSPRPAYRVLPLEERRIVRRKTFVFEPMTVEQAIWEMRLLDYDFFLFTNSATGEEELVYERTGEERPRLKRGSAAQAVSPAAFEADPEPAPTLGDPEACALLDLAGEQFVFFRDRDTGRGAVVYRRYDGHYGVLTAAVQQ